MQEPNRSKIKYVIASNKQAIKSSKPKAALLHNPDMLRSIQERDKLKIGLLLSRLREQYSELFPFVKKVKLHINDIIEETYVCAIYLLLCHVFDNWNSFFILAENGRSSAAGNVIRTIKEGIMQIELFSIDSLSEERTNLDKWFSGDIIRHVTGRRKVGEYFDESLPFSEVNVKELSSQVYQIESQVSHNAYASILELVSPFTEDYDFDGYSGYHRTLAWLRYASGSLEATNIVMKMVYLMVIKDAESFKKINEILVRYSPETGRTI